MGDFHLLAGDCTVQFSPALGCLYWAIFTSTWALIQRNSHLLARLLYWAIFTNTWALILGNFHLLAGDCTGQFSLALGRLYSAILTY